MSSLEAKLEKIRSPRLQNQQQAAVVLNAVEDILRDQKTEFTPSAYFVALLSLLPQSISPSKITNKDLATSTVYLLDTFTPHTPAPLLCSKFVQILTHLVPALTHRDAEAPLLRSAIGVLEGLLLAQDGPSWAIKPTEIGPRRAVAGLLNLGLDDRPKVRKRAQEALTNILSNPPPSPSLDHPASDMCAATTLAGVQELVKMAEGHKKKQEHDPRLIHSLQLVKAVAAAGGWPSKRIEPLCEVLMSIAKGGNEFLTMAALGVFEEVFDGLVEEVGGGKLEVVIEAIRDLKPSHNDSQLLPAWLGVIARGYEVYAQISEDEAFRKVPELFDLVSQFLESSAHNVRTSASQCLIAIVNTCIPESALLDITRSTEQLFGKIAKAATDLLQVRYQGAWMEVFEVLNHLFMKYRWKASPHLNEAVKAVGDLRSNESFQGKKQADEVLSSAVHAMGPEAVLDILPLNLVKPAPGEPGRAWLLPILRDSVYNTKLAHFRKALVPLSEAFYQKVVEFGEGEKTVEIKIFETLVAQIWSILPGYCDLPMDLVEAFDQSFAEMLANVLYQKVELRSDICKALQNLVDSNKAILEMELDEAGEEDLVVQRRVTKEQAQKNLDHLAGFAGNMLAVLFNVYSTTLPQFRGFILKCLNSFLSITPHEELMSTFNKVTTMLSSSLAELTAQTQADKEKKNPDSMPPMAHTLMDLVITITPYLPPASYADLFNIFNATVSISSDPQLQKKAYKVIPRLSETDTGRVALASKSSEFQTLLVNAKDSATAPARRDRLVALAQMIPFLDSSDLHFIPAVLPEVVISAKEVNEKARTAAFDLLVAMGERMQEGGTVINRLVSHMPDGAPDAPATLEEYFTMVSAGLAGSNPTMVSASITALTRIMWQFKDSVDSNVLSELVATLDLFLTSKNREIVRSVLGFVKVCVISLPKDMMETRLPTLVPNLMVWSHEHKAHFKAKVKHIIERMVRRFGVEIVEKYTPEEDKKLIANIRKTRERRKRKKEEAKAGGADSDDEEAAGHKQQQRKSRFENEFDEAIYGSDDSDANSESEDEAPNRAAGPKKKKSASTAYIHEDEEEPLDLLDKRALANISSTRPLKKHTPGQSARRQPPSGKLIISADSVKTAGEDDVDMELDDPAKAGSSSAIDAYVEAIAGKNAYTKGQRGRVKFSNKRAREDDVDMEDAGDEPSTGAATAGYESAGKKRNSWKIEKSGRGGGRGGFKGQVAGRRGLGVEKRKEGAGGRGGRGGRR